MCNLMRDTINDAKKNIAQSQDIKIQNNNILNKQINEKSKSPDKKLINYIKLIK